MTTINLTGGDLGREKMQVRGNLGEATAQIEVNWNDGEGWLGTQYQCADTGHTVRGLISIGKKIAARGCEMRKEDFDCDASVAE